jgi:hypothetical protein
MINSDESDVGEQNQREDDIESEPWQELGLSYRK